MITDTHAHLDMEEFDRDREDVLGRAMDSGISPGKHNTSNEAPHRLSPPSMITRLTISGDESADENSSANYTATATFSDGSTQNVTAKINWSEDSPYAGINSGVLTTADVPNDHTVFITAATPTAGLPREQSSR